MFKKIISSKRLDRIAPKCDRSLITAAAVILFSSVLCAAIAVFLNLAGITVYAMAANITGYALWLIAEFIIIKETIRNRFFSAVLLLLLSIAFLSSLITGTVLIFG